MAYEIDEPPHGRHQSAGLDGRATCQPGERLRDQLRAPAHDRVDGEQFLEATGAVRDLRLRGGHP
ncbi:hypothetical protein [Streptomyces sp. NPDC001530]|uniref:hypothetical protein n=1 Tax=Streptomyces sp. NPDC001530 TaxID=3364582 RepID=UPI0036894160